ncbi:MAG: hypothetical protein ACP5LG_06855, partial [Conexivisphaera sp.]
MSNVDERSRSHVFRIPISWFAPGRDLVAVRVRADSAAKLGMLWDYLMKDGIEILGTMLNTIPEGVVALAILDVTEVGRDAAMVILRSVPIDYLRIEVMDQGVREFAFTGGHVLESGSGRSIVMSERTLGGFFRGMRELMGDDAGAAFLYYVGFVSGREWGRFLADRKYDRSTAVRINFETLKSQGYATSITVLEGEDVYRIEVRDLVECGILSGYVAERGGHVRTSHWFRGTISGFLSAVRGG